MTKQSDTSIDDLSESINLLATAMEQGFAHVNEKIDQGFKSVDKRFNEVNQRLDALEAAQRETNRRLDNLEDTMQTLEADIKEMYLMIADLQRERHTLTKEEKARLQRLVAFAQKVSKKTGIPFPI